MEQYQSDLEEDLVSRKYGEGASDFFLTLLLFLFYACGVYALVDIIYKEVSIYNFLSLFSGIICMFSMAVIFSKARESDWKAFVPIYNIITLLKIVGKPARWIFLFLIPGVNIVYAVWMINLLSLKFGKEEGFTVGLFILPFIFYPILAFGDAQFNNELPKHETGGISTSGTEEK